MQHGDISASGPTSMWSTFPVEDATPGNGLPSPELTYQYLFRQDPTIQLRMQSHETQLSEQCQWNRYLPSINPELGFTRLEHDMLLHRCFSFHTVWLYPLEPEIFLHDMLTELTPGHGSVSTMQFTRALGYSPFLHCALMALATAFSDNPSIRAKGTRNQFALRAKQYLESECERPTLTAVRALALLSEYHGSFGERGLEYLYFGTLFSIVACRIDCGRMHIQA